jgi:predicted dehydrogenase
VRPITVACAGAGYWGKNLVRVFHDLPGVRLKAVCDPSPAVRQALGRQYPGLRLEEELQAVLADPEVEAVVLAVPAVRHYEAARQALEAGKQVYVEKPLAMSSAEAGELVELAAAKNRVLMVGHLLMYHPAVEFLAELVRRGELGEIYYLYAQRVNLGIVRRDENALWSLAPHDVSMILHLVGQEPATVSARGACYLQRGIEDVVFVNLQFPAGAMAQIQVSWLDPHKVRRLTIVGSEKMALFDDAESAEKVRIYDKAAQRRDYESYGEAITLRFGDVVIPHLDMAEPLKLECQHFADCVREHREPRSGGREGLRVVRVLEAAQRSLALRGAPVELQPCLRELAG